MIQNQRQIYVCLHVSLVGVFVRWFVCADCFKHLMTVWPCQQHIAALKSEIKTCPNESKKPLRQVSWAFLPWFELGNTAKGSFWGNCSLRAFKGRWISCTSHRSADPGLPGLCVLQLHQSTGALEKRIWVKQWTKSETRDVTRTNL